MWSRNVSRGESCSRYPSRLKTHQNFLVVYPSGLLLVKTMAEGTLYFITARKRSLRSLCFYTCLSFCPWGGGGVGSASVHDGIPPRADPPLGPVPPPQQCMLGDTVNQRAVCMLLECNLVGFVLVSG